MKRSVLWSMVGAAACLPGWRATGWARWVSVPTRCPCRPRPGLQVLELVLTDLNGQPQNFAQWRGKVLIVNYWATWCQPCREEMPGFSRLQDKYRDKGVQFVGISSDPQIKSSNSTKQPLSATPC